MIEPGYSSEDKTVTEQKSGRGELKDVLKAAQGQWRSLALVIGIVFLLGAIILVIYYTTHVNVRHILDDPAETALLPEYAGLYSNIGVLVLWTSAVVGFVSARFGDFVSPVQRRLLKSYAAIISFLALDDLFMLHESGGLLLARFTKADDIAGSRSALEAIIFAIYIIVVFGWAWKFRNSIWQSPWPLIALGGLGFAASIVLDLAPYVISSLEDQPMRIETMLAVAEDLFKLLGIGGLAAYGLALAIVPLRRAKAQPSDLGTK